MSEVLLRVAAKATIVYKGNVLIVREAGTYAEGSQIGRYGLPGGRINPEEPFFEALAREVREETGLVVRPVKPVLLGEWWPEIKGTKNHIVAMFVECQATTDKVTLSEEHDAFEWVSAKNYAKFNIVEPDVKAVEKVISG